MNCKYNGLGCGHESGCIRCQEDAEAKCKTYNYMVWLDCYTPKEMIVMTELTELTELEVLERLDTKPAIGWGKQALNALKQFVSIPRDTFQCEDIRAYAISIGVPEPTTTRAWGGVIRAAKNAGLICNIGYRAVRNPNAHRTPASLWERGAQI